MKKYLCTFFSLVFVVSNYAQIISERELLETILPKHPSTRLAELEVNQQEALRRTAFNPPQPLFAVETPTDAGIAYELEQEFDWPGVYTNRSAWLKSKVNLSAASATLIRKQIIRDLRLAYLSAQLAKAQVRFYAQQDSLWKEITSKSLRLYEGGEINKADLLFAERHAGLVSNSLSEAQANAAIALDILSSYASIPVPDVEILQALPSGTAIDSTHFSFEKYYIQKQQVTMNELGVRKAERLPGFLLGYLRATDPETQFRYRYKAGITIPIWQGQYKGEVMASKIALEQTQSELALERQRAQLDLIRFTQIITQTKRSLAWFENTALPMSNEIISTYQRLFDAGETDYAITLRSISETRQITNQYLETLNRHNTAVIELEYLLNNE